MEDVDRPNHIQTLPEPASACRPSVETKPLRFMSHPESLDGLLRHRGRRRHVRQKPAIRPTELERAVGTPRDRVAFLVNCAMMPATQERQVRKRRRSTVRPVADVMAL